MKTTLLLIIAFLPEILLTGIAVIAHDYGIARKTRLVGILTCLLFGGAILTWGSLLLYSWIHEGDLATVWIIYAFINVIWGLVILIGGTVSAAYSPDTITDYYEPGHDGYRREETEDEATENEAIENKVTEDEVTITESDKKRERTYRARRTEAHDRRKRDRRTGNRY